jgi:hypothetical protein
MGVVVLFWVDVEFVEQFSGGGVDDANGKVCLGSADADLAESSSIEQDDDAAATHAVMSHGA